MCSRAAAAAAGLRADGIADLQLPSVVALLAFFAGGLLGTFVLLPLVLRL
jgi:hypothetical protein